MNSAEKSFLQTTQQLAGNESINTTRLLILNSEQADVHYSKADLGWVIPKSQKRSYLQQRILLQKFKIWNVFKTVHQDASLILEDGRSINIFEGNWTPESLAGYLTDQLTVYMADGTTVDTAESTTVTYDPYQLHFTFCGKQISIDPLSTANKYLGFPDGAVSTPMVSSFPPTALQGIQSINIWTNVTMNNIPASSFLCSVPVTAPYGSYIFYINNDNSQATLSLDPDLQYLRLILKDDNGNVLNYPDELSWEAQLGLQGTYPEGFSPLIV